MSDKELRELRRKDMSMVFQSFALMPHLTVLQNAAFGLELSGIGPAQRLPRARQALEQVGLGAWVENFPYELSGGMQQRVGLARALANDPSVLLMDEAFSALDPLIRSEMQDELLNLQQTQQRTIIFISHDLDEAIRIGDRIAIMEGGRVVQVGTPEEILNNPADEYVRSFFRGVDVSSVFAAGDIARKTQVTVIEHGGMGVRAALQRLNQHDRDFGYVIDRGHKFEGIVSVESLKGELENAAPTLQRAFLPDVDVVNHDTALGDLFGPLAQHPYGLPVVSGDGRYVGTVSKATMLETLDKQAR
jgi:glycine betaine/proline transport system ATP-binding protein